MIVLTYLFQLILDNYVNLICPYKMYVQNYFRPSKLFWTGTNCFGQVQIRLFWTIFYNLNLSKMNQTHPKRLVLDQNYLEGPKSFWTHRRTRHLKLRSLRQNYLRSHKLIYKQGYKKYYGQKIGQSKYGCHVLVKA